MIIEKIEIKSFRSCANLKGNTFILKNTSSLNIISGKNDSGKSNVLRALNLFFNGQTDFEEFFAFDKDFYKESTPHKESNLIKEKIVTIKIHFHQDFSQSLPEKFWISRKWKPDSKFGSYQQDDNVETQKRKNSEKFSKHFDNEKEANYKANAAKLVTDFLNSIQFQYIPAIKDSKYFASLYGELHRTLVKARTSKLDSSSDKFQKEIQESTNSLMEEFKKQIKNDVSDLPAFHLPPLTGLFENLDVKTGEINLRQKGDGIQAKLIPEILHFILKQEKKLTAKKVRKKEKAKKYFIWGFEEPENSYEYQNAQLLSERFLNIFSQEAQIFLTTHSFNFLSLFNEKNKDKVSIYRVYKKENSNYSEATLVKEKKEKDYLNNELGFFTFHQELQKVYDDYIKDLKEQEVLKNENNILYVEDEKTDFYKIAYLKFKAINFEKNDIDEKFNQTAGFKIFGVGGCKELKEKINRVNMKEFANKKVLALFDFDRAYDSFNGLNTQRWEKIEEEKNEAKILSRRSKSIDNLKAILLPIPNDEILQKLASQDLGGESKLTIEMYLHQKGEKYFEEKRQAGGGTYKSCKGKSKTNLRNDMIGFPKKDFDLFKPLFCFLENFYQTS